MLGWQDLTVMINSMKGNNYFEDERLSLIEMYQSFEILEQKGWLKELICFQKVEGSDAFPIYGYLSVPNPTEPIESLWIMGGVHGEEPAGPNAFAQMIDHISALKEYSIPVMFLPMLNPSRYSRDFRYENEFRDFRKGQSVTDSEHLLLNDEGRARSDQPISQTSKEITGWVVKNFTTYLPKLVIDHHEDRVPERFSEGDPRSISGCYVYYSGRSRKKIEIAASIVDIFRQCGLPVIEKGVTRFGESVAEGILENGPDGSIDELMMAKKYVDLTTITKKYPAMVGIVVETTIPFNGGLALQKRVDAHNKIIMSYKDFWDSIDG